MFPTFRTISTRIALRWEEMRYATKAPPEPDEPEVAEQKGKKGGAGKAGAAPSAAEPVAASRRRHPKEAPFIKLSDYGIFRILHANKKATPGVVDEAGKPLEIADLYKHMMVFGGSGSGKTFYVLQTIWEEWFRSTHIPDGADREKKKFGALIIEAKGDFRDKTWFLSQTYGRMDDFIAFGPTHQDVVYDMFGDPTESPLQLANKMLSILKAASEGKSGADPFWDNSAKKLFLNLIYLHSYVKKRLEACQSDAEKEKFAHEPLSFQLLNLLLKGQPKNVNEIRAATDGIGRMWGMLRDVIGHLRTLTVYLDTEVERLGKTVEKLETENEALLNKYEEDFAFGPPMPEPAGGVDDITTEPTDDPPMPTPEQETAWLSVMAERKETLDYVRSAIGGLKLLIGSQGREKTVERFGAKCERLRKAFVTMSTATNDEARGAASNEAVSICTELSLTFRRRMAALDVIGMGDGKLKEHALRFIDLADQFQSARDGIVRLNGQVPKPAYGALRKLITQYEEIMKETQKEPMLDPVWAYFDQEYLNVANDKTSGSVAMVASQLVAMFVHPPFSSIFAPKATFNFNNAIDSGQIVYLDMPTSFYGATATVASLVMKIDFFRCMLSRKRLTTRDAAGKPTDKMVNQERPMAYFADEFGSIVTTGSDTGEAGFMDKVREFKCACLLGLQSYPTLTAKVPETEAKTIVANTALKVFLRNPEQDTNKLASEMCGTEVKVNATLSQDPGEMRLGPKNPGQRDYSTSYSKGSRVDSGSFTTLQDGEAVVILPARFKKNMIQKIQFIGHPINPPDAEDLFPLPTCILE